MENTFEIIFNKLTIIEGLLNEIKSDNGNFQKKKESYPDYLNITQALQNQTKLRKLNPSPGIKKAGSINEPAARIRILQRKLISL